MSNTPSKAEIEALAQQHLKAFVQFSLGEVWFEGEVEFARAVLARWGTPQPVVREPLTANQVSGLAESAGYWHGDMSRADFINGIRYAEAAPDITKKRVQHGTE